MQLNKAKSIVLLYADDDPEDRMLAKEALAESRLLNDLRLVEDGQDVMDYLKNEGKYTDRQKNPNPGLLLLDLNMPKKDGREVIAEMKADDRLKRIPIVVLTTSSAEEDIIRSYDLGVNSFITKPVTFESLVDIMRTLGKYWFEVVVLPETYRDRN